MAEASPPTARPIATGALRRVFRQRNDARRAGSPTKRRPVTVESESEGESDSDGETEDAGGAVAITSSPRKARAGRTMNTSHHYTLNMPSPTAAPPDTPYVLLGCVLAALLLHLSLCMSRLVCKPAPGL